VLASSELPQGLHPVKSSPVVAAGYEREAPAGLENVTLRPGIAQAHGQAMTLAVRPHQGIGGRSDHDHAPVGIQLGHPLGFQMNRESITKIVGKRPGQEQVFLRRKRRDGNDGLFIKNEIAAGLDDFTRRGEDQRRLRGLCTAAYPQDCCSD